jgi:sulfite exporter TauE/SafE
MSHLIQALTLGFLYGIGPCTAFCAPILIPLIASTSKNSKEGLIQTLALYSGKISSYVFLGLVSGYLGRLFGGFISIKAIGIFVIGLGIFTLLKKYEKKCLFLKRITGKHLSFLSGLLIGLRPCPAFLALLSLAVLTGSAFTGGLMGMMFGVGTLLSPLIILGLLAGKWAELEKFRGINALTGGIFLILLGVWKIWM